MTLRDVTRPPSGLLICISAASQLQVIPLYVISPLSAHTATPPICAVTLPLLPSSTSSLLRIIHTHTHTHFLLHTTPRALFSRIPTYSHPNPGHSRHPSRMGNNPSRTHAHHQHHHHQQHSIPTSPPTANVPARAASTSSPRTRLDRRNSLQQVPAARHPATPSASVPPEDPLLPARPRNDPTSSSETRYIPQGPRERIAEAISSAPWTINNARNPSGFHRVDDDEDEDDEMLTSPSRNHPPVPTNPTPAAGDDLPSRLGTPPADVAEPHADPAALAKRGSMGSTTTVDEDEVDVADTRTIPTLIQWSQPGHKVCVTGTFSNWRRRFKLSRRYVCPLGPIDFPR